jgi:phospholipid/cholesterol/gamma-HCH transport system permease protein
MSSTLALRNIALSLAGYSRLFAYTARHLDALRIPPVRTVFNRQVYFTGIEALRTSTFLALLCGSLIATQVIIFTGNNSELVNNVLTWVIVRELAPLIIAIVIIARSSAAIASELALMRIHNEMRLLEFMGISHYNYLIVPRVVGVALSVVVLNIYFQLVAVGGGLFVSSLFQHVSYLEHLNRFFVSAHPMDFVLSNVKGLFHGIIIATSACYHGLNVGNSMTEVPKATTRAVTHGIVTVFVFDAVFAYLSFI